MTKNIKILLLSLVTITIIISLLVVFLYKDKNESSKDKITIITTLFPTYDFSKNIAGDLADIKLLISPGTDSHSYEPSINDIATISKSSLFVYTGEDLEPWTFNITSSLKDKITSVNVSESINLYENLDEDEDLKYDPHIWMSVKNAKIMCENIYNALCLVDEKNKDTYTENYNTYISRLNILEEKYNEIKNNDSNKKLVFASPFSYLYLIKEYNLDYISAYGFCSEVSEPSVSDMKKIIDYLNTNESKYILCDKLFSKNTATAISNETNSTILDFNSIHNISKDDLDSSIGYIELMEENLNSIKTILK